MGQQILVSIHVHHRAVQRADHLIDTAFDHLCADRGLVDVGHGEVASGGQQLRIPKGYFP